MLTPRFKTCRHISKNVWQIKKLTQKQKAIILKLQKKKQINNNLTFPSNYKLYKKFPSFMKNYPLKKYKNLKCKLI